MAGSVLVIIMGPKHSGKTSAGKALARLVEGAFTDLDDLVEQRSGKSPRQLYKEGPECFRHAEAEALRSLLEAPDAGAPPDTPPLIAATGGGIADNGEALALLAAARRAAQGAAQGAAQRPAAMPPAAQPIFTVYIDLPVESAWLRIRAAADETGELPPFLNTPDPRETHRQLHERRAKIYRELADFTVAAGNTPEETAARILDCFTKK